MIYLLYFFSFFLLTIVFSKIIIRKLKLVRIRERIEESCIAELHKDKIGTPTIGGIIMIMSLLVFVIVYYLITNTFLIQVFIILTFGLLGLIDDIVKLRQIRKGGLSYKQKIVGLIIFSVVVLIYLQNNLPFYYKTYIPFLNYYKIINDNLYNLFVIIFILATTNSANITDGLDGLLSGISIIIFMFFFLISIITNNQSIAIISIIFAAIISAFLLFNKHPAKVFMGNTGALLIGGGFSVISLYLRVPLVLLLIAGICVFETLSVIIQLISKKYFNKTVFKIAPFHHHLQKCDYKETTIVYMFWTMTMVLCVIGFYSIRSIK